MSKSKYLSSIGSYFTKSVSNYVKNSAPASSYAKLAGLHSDMATANVKDAAIYFKDGAVEGSTACAKVAAGASATVGAAAIGLNALPYTTAASYFGIPYASTLAGGATSALKAGLGFYVANPVTTYLSGTALASGLNSVHNNVAKSASSYAGGLFKTGQALYNGYNAAKGLSNAAAHYGLEKVVGPIEADENEGATEMRAIDDLATSVSKDWTDMGDETPSAHFSNKTNNAVEHELYNDWLMPNTNGHQDGVEIDMHADVNVSGDFDFTINDAGYTESL